MSLDQDSATAPPNQPARTGLRISHVAALVPDIDASIRFLGELLGWGPWSVYQLVDPRLDSQSYRGSQGEFGMIGAETHLGDIDFALNQSVNGPSVYTEYLERCGHGLHHIACMAGPAGIDGVRQRFADQGIGVAMGGRIDDTIEFMYFDTEPALGVAIESGSGHAISLQPDREVAPNTGTHGAATFTEVALAVDDLDQAIESFTDILGWGPWKIEADVLEEARRNGAPVDIAFRVGRARNGPLTVALVQPTVGPSAEADALRLFGNGLHHIACGLGLDDRGRANEVLRDHHVAKIISGRENDREVWYLESTPRVKLLFK